MFPRFRTLILLFCLVLPGVAHAEQTYTFHLLDLLLHAGERFAFPVGLAGTGVVAVDDFRQAARITWPEKAITPIECPGFQRYPGSVRLSPEVVGIAGNQTVVGNDQPAGGGQIGFELALDGTCHFTLLPGSVVTYFTGNNSAGDVVGTYFKPQEVEGALLGIHGFLREGGAIVPLEIGVNARVFPLDINDGGTIIALLWLHINQSDNSFEQQWAIRDPATGNWTYVDLPDGRNFIMRKLNNSGQILGDDGEGHPWLYDSVAQTFTALPLPSAGVATVLVGAFNDAGWWAGRYAERDANNRLIVRTFVALPTPPPPAGEHTTPPATPPARQKETKVK